jgi:hypothetical protein
MAASWEYRKAAAIEYSRYRPLLEATTFTPEEAVVRHQLPEGVFGAEFVEYGTMVSLEEIASAADGEQGWCVHGNALYLTPAPEPGVPIRVLWRKVHEADEDTETFPTIPQTDQHLVEWLAEAEELDQTVDAVTGLSGYTIGSTKVEWSQQGGGGPSGATRAQRLRLRALAALDTPYAEWG